MGSRPNQPPEGYQTPKFPSLNVHTLYDSTPNRTYTLFYIEDVWRFTLTWTLVLYALFHLGAVLVAFFTHGWKRSSWKYLWAIPVLYLVMAGFEALLAGSIIGLVYVRSMLDFEIMLTPLQTWRRLPCRLLRDEYLDSVHLGFHQRTCVDHLILLYTRRFMIHSQVYG